MDNTQTLRESQIVRVGADDVLTPVDIENHLGALERAHIVVEAAHFDRLRREEAVTVGRLAGHHRVGGEIDHDGFVILAAERRGDGADRAYPGEPPVTPLHRFGPAKTGNDPRQDLCKEGWRGLALLVDMGDVVLALFGIGLDPGVRDRRKARSLQEAVDGLLRRADARPLLLLSKVRRASRNPRHRQREPARRDEGARPFVEQACLDQRVRHRFLEILRRLALEAGGDFLGEDFEQEFRHFRSGLEGARGLPRGRPNVH